VGTTTRALRRRGVRRVYTLVPKNPGRAHQNRLRRQRIYGRGKKKKRGNADNSMVASTRVYVRTYIYIHKRLILDFE